MNTKKFIETYCEPTRRVITPEMFNDMVEHPIENEKVRRHLLKMSHLDYLRTDYWRIISVFMRSKIKECKCGSKENLQVHHNTYKYIGIEYIHASCLEVLCDKCHSLIHSCADAPKSKDKGVGYSSKKDLSLFSLKEKQHKKRLKSFYKNELLQICKDISEMVNGNNIDNIGAIKLIGKIKEGLIEEDTKQAVYRSISEE